MATVTPVIAGAGLETLQALVRRMFPHDSFPDGPYERCAQSIAEAASQDARLSAQMQQGLAELEAAGFASKSPEDALAYLHAISASPFFQHVRGEVITSLYNDREVWELLGYEAESFDQGGYLERGFDDLDWLPAARVEGPQA